MSSTSSIGDRGVCVCPVCFEIYNDTTNMPTTFPCGHTLCIKHVGQLNGKCMVCRRDIPRVNACFPSRALIDAAMFIRKMVEQIPNLESMMEQFEDGEGEGRKGGRDVVDSTNDLAPDLANLVSMGFSLVSVRAASTLLNTTDINILMEYLLDGANDLPPTPPYVADTNRNRPSMPPLIRSLSDSSRRSSSLSAIKGCGHVCTPGSLPLCCACMDRREMQTEGTYPKYVDGTGWCDIGNRNDGYCPACKPSPLMMVRR